jgi:hypothetical protein
MKILLKIGDVDAEAELLDDVAPGAVRALVDVLPLTGGTLLPSCWSGAACEVDLSRYGYRVPDGEGLVCSLYPGSLAVRPADATLLISYGTAESRTARGVTYAVRIGRITQNRAAALAELARSHDVGELPVSLRAA